MGSEAKNMHETVIGDGNVSANAWAKYMEIACRITARCTDEELGITPADYLEPSSTEDDAAGE